MNVALVLILFMYLWIIVGMNLLGNLKIQDNEAGINRHANYRHFGTSMLLQLRCAGAPLRTEGARLGVEASLLVPCLARGDACHFHPQNVGKDQVPVGCHRLPQGRPVIPI